MARVLIVTAALTLEHLTGADLEAANEGLPIPSHDEDDPDDDDDEDCRFTGTDADLDEVYPSEIAGIAVDHVVQSNDEIWAGTSIAAKFTDGKVIGARWQQQDEARTTPPDRGLVAAMAAQDINKVEAEDMAQRVNQGLLIQLLASKGVSIPGIGKLVLRKRKKTIVAPGPDRGKRVEEWFVALTGAAVLRRGEPYDPI